jgi:hypothetical protein
MTKEKQRAAEDEQGELIYITAYLHSYITLFISLSYTGRGTALPCPYDRLYFTQLKMPIEPFKNYLMTVKIQTEKDFLTASTSIKTNQELDKHRVQK